MLIAILIIITFIHNINFINYNIYIYNILLNFNYIRNIFIFDSKNSEIIY